MNYREYGARLRSQAFTAIMTFMKRRNAIRWVPAILAVVILAHGTLPTIVSLIEHNLYQLSPEALRVVGGANKNLSAKFSYDSDADSWLFNKEGKSLRAAQIADQQGSNPEEVASALAQMQTQIGGGGEKDKSLYSVELPSDAKDGVTFHDNQTSQSFSMVPRFATGDGKKWQDRIIYPFGGAGQIVYTAKTNGIKEDIVLNEFIGEELSYAYDLKLTDALDARLMPDGSIGVFSADPTLYSSITYGDNADRKKIEDARKNAEKTHLSFAIPAPVVVDANGEKSAARYTLVNDTLTVIAKELDKLKYPISIDPSVAITSSSDFERGNDEGMIDYSTSGQISGAQTTGGAVGPWSTTSVASSQAPLRYAIGAAAYNNHVYMVGGNGNSTVGASVHYAEVGSDGTLGAWQSTTSMPHSRMYPSVVAYNGYLYAYGGGDNNNLGGINYDTVIFAQINQNGTLGEWTESTNTMPTAVCRAGSAISGNYIYSVGGQTSPGGNCPNAGATVVSTVQFAPILANGEVGTWSTTSSIITARMSMGVAEYNGFLYINGGTEAGINSMGDTQVSKVNSDGTLTSWQNANSNTPANLYRHGMTAYKGYLYVAGGGSDAVSNVLVYARINADGSVGNWTTGTALVSATTSMWGFGLVPYKDRLYVYGSVGCDGVCADSQYASILPNGSVTRTQTSTVAGASLGGAYSAVYKGYIYHFGGSLGGTSQSTVRYAAINADGSYGSWSTTSAMASASHYGGSAVYNGRVYVFGGFSSSVVQYASFNANGTLSAWQTTTALPVTCGNHSGAAYNGFLYYVCGTGGNGFTSTIKRAPINADGTVGTWVNESNTFNEATTFEDMYIYNGYLYVVGGSRSGVAYDLVRVSKIQSNGTLGAFSNTSSLQQPLLYAKVEVINGYMYRVGGENGSTVRTSTIEYAQINPDGTLGTWQYTDSLPQTVSRSTLTVNGDMLYTISGTVNGSPSTTSYRATVSSGGSGAATSWATTTNLPTARYNNDMVAYNGFMYTSGGYNSGSYFNTVHYSPIGANGTLGSWQATTSFSTGREAHKMIALNGYMYIIGGSYSFPRVYLNDVQYAPINSDGSLGSWNTTTDIGTAALVKANTAVYDNRIYIVGRSLGGTNREAHFATANTNGTLSPWQATTSLPSGAAISGSSIVAYGGYMYSIGGLNASAAAASTTFVARINSDGTLGSWERTTDTIRAIQGAMTVAVNGYVYLLTGSDGGSTRYDDVQYATVLSDGKLGKWSHSKSFTNARSSSTALINGGKLYIGGGFDGTTTYNDVQYATILTIERSATYSALITLPEASTLNGVYYNGSVTNDSLLTYRVAGIDGEYGSRQTIGSGTGADVDVCIAGNDRYVFIRTTLDDSMRFAYGGEYVPSYITGITANYSLSKRASPEQRLLGGKSFRGETLRDLDTCGNI